MQRHMKMSVFLSRTRWSALDASLQEGHRHFAARRKLSIGRPMPPEIRLAKGG